MRPLIDFGTVIKKSKIPIHRELVIPPALIADPLYSPFPLIERVVPISYEVIVQTEAHGRVTYNSQDPAFQDIWEHLVTGSLVEVEYLPRIWKDKIVAIKEPFQSKYQ